MSLKTPFKVTIHMSKLIDEISSLRERIVSSKIKIAWKPIMQREAIIRNAMGSTAIEGFVLSLPEVAALAKGTPKSHSLSTTERAVLNYLAALRLINKGKYKHLSHTMICELHKMVAEGASEDHEVGKYRTVQNYVVDGLGQVVYRPPNPKHVHSLMDKLIEFTEEKAEDYLPIISSGIIHYQFVDIHPFVDGNGRVARLLGTWELIRRKFDTDHIFAVDDIIYEHKSTYYAAIQSVRKQQGDMTNWLEYYFETVAESLSRAWMRIMKLPRSGVSESLSFTPKQEKVVNLLRDAGDLSAKDIADSLKVTVQGVHFILKPLIKAKIVVRKGGKKTGKFGLT